MSRSGRRFAGLALLLAAGLAAWLLGRDTSRDEASAARPSAGSGPSASEPSALPEARDSFASTGSVDRAAETLAPATREAAAAPAAAMAISARVVRPDGTPVEGASLGLAAGRFEDPSDALVQATSRADGRFTLELSERDAQLVLGRDGWLLARHGELDVGFRRVPALQLGARDAGDIVLGAGAGLKGRTVTPDGAPVSGVAVQLRLVTQPDPKGSPRYDQDLEGQDRDLAAAQRELRQLRTDPQGAFSLIGLPAGTGRLEIEPVSAKDLALDGLLLRAGAMLDLGDIRLDEGLSIDGVLLKDGVPVPEWEVRVDCATGLWPEREGDVERKGLQVSQAYTDAEGRFHLAGLSATEYQFNCTVTGRGRVLRSVRAGEHDLRIELPAPSTVLVTLRDARSGEGVTEASFTANVVTKLANGSRFEGEGGVAIVHGPEVGLAADCWRLQGVGADGASLLIDSPGHSPAQLEVPPLLPGASWSQRVLLERPLRLSGRVVGADGAPVEAAVVQIGPQAGVAKGLATKMLRTDASGTFAFEGLARGTWQAWAYAEGFVGQASTSLEFEEQDRADLVFQLTSGGSLVGTALARDGSVVANSRVLAWRERALIAPAHGVDGASLLVTANLPSEQSSANPEAGGQYRFGPLVPGDYLVTAALASNANALNSLRTLAETKPAIALPPSVKRVAVAAGAETRLDLLLPQPARVSGLVRVGGHAVSGARVALLAEDAGRWNFVDAVDADAGGAFEFMDLTALSGAVVAGVPGELRPILSRVALKEGDDVHVELDVTGPGLAGRVENVIDKQPVADVHVQTWLAKLPENASADELALAAILQSGALQSATLPGGRATSDAAGRFALPHLAAGHWRFTASGGAWLPAGMAEVDVGPDWTPSDVIVPVKAGAIVQGSVRWQLGGPAGDELEIAICPPDKDTLVQWVHPVDGHYSLEGLRPGNYVLQVKNLAASGGVLHRENIELAAGQRLTIDLVVGT